MEPNSLTLLTLEICSAGQISSRYHWSSRVILENFRILLTSMSSFFLLDFNKLPAWTHGSTISPKLCQPCPVSYQEFLLDFNKLLAMRVELLCARPLLQWSRAKYFNTHDAVQSSYNGRAQSTSTRMTRYNRITMVTCWSQGHKNNDGGETTHVIPIAKKKHFHWITCSS